MKRQPTFLALLTLTGSLCAQTASLKGTVTDVSGAPVAGATVKLEKLAVTVTSGADGSFTLATGGTGVQGSTWENLSGIFLRQGIVQVSLSEAAPFVLTVQSPDGRILATTSMRLEAGDHQIAPPKTGAGLRIYRVRVGDREEVIRAVSAPGEEGVLVQGRGVSRSTAAKTAAGSALYDAISATKTGYLTSYVSVTTSDSAGIQVKLLPSTFPKFSFFVISLKAVLDLSGNANGFGGDLRYGQTGPGAGLRGADKICGAVAERSLANASFKGWRAFLSVKSDSYGVQANAIDRVGPGPWYDRVGKLLAPTKADLISSTGRPSNGDATIRASFPNEDGIPNKQPDPSQPEVDNHHTLTGSTTTGTLYNPNSTTSTTCADWTTNAAVKNIRPRTGWAWTMDNRIQWISGSDEGGCGAGMNLVQTGGADFNNPIVGSGGGYGAWYCFALNP